MKKVLLWMAALFVLAGAAFAGTSLKDELEQGKTINENILRAYKVSDDEKAVSELESIGKHLAAKRSRKEITYKFTLLRSDEYNAYAALGGFVYFTDTLWYAMTPNERAGVLAHEIMHVEKRHAVKGKDFRWATGVATVFIRTNSTAEHYLLYGARDLGILKYSRDQEQEADLQGSDLCKAVGYDPACVYQAMVKLTKIFEQLGAHEGWQMLSDHPNTDNRVGYLGDYVKGLGCDIPKDEYDIASNKFKKIGTMTESSTEFTADNAADISVGDVYWAMRPGWNTDFNVKMDVPSLKLTVKQKDGNKITCDKEVVIAKVKNEGNGVYVVSEPSLDAWKNTAKFNDKCEVESVSLTVKNFERYCIIANVWNDGNTRIVTKIVGTIVPAGGKYITYINPKYEYAVANNTCKIEKIDAAEDDGNEFVGVVEEFKKTGDDLISKNTTAGKIFSKIAGKKDYLNAKMNIPVSNHDFFCVVLPDDGTGMPFEDRIICTASVRSAKNSRMELVEIMPGHRELPPGAYIYRVKQGE